MTYKVARLSQFANRLPSEILKLSEAGADDSTCLDFDFAVVQFWDWLEARQSEQKPGTDTGPKLRDGQVWVPKYRYLEDILSTYHRHRDAVLDPIVAAMSNDDMLDLMETWDPTLPAL